MAAGELERLGTALEALPVAAILTDLDARRFVVVNERAAELFGVPAKELVGTDVVSHVHPGEQDAVINAYCAIARRDIDAYQVRRRIITPDGSELTLNIWGRRVDSPDGAYGLWVLTPEPAHGAFDALSVRPVEVVLAITDHDWQLQYVSADAHLLGVPGDQLRGQPLLGLVHPSVAAEFLEATARAVEGRMAATVATRLRAGADGWADRYVLLVPMCEHQPPRLGIVVTPRAPMDTDAPDRALGPHVEHSAVEARATAALRAMPTLAGHPGAVGLSARQIEIVSRLVDGERIDEIARALYLSPSTVRNHLTAIYRKFGVHSQAELLAALLRAGTHDSPPTRRA